jgi:hypothetical protein
MKRIFSQLNVHFINARLSYQQVSKIRAYPVLVITISSTGRDFSFSINVNAIPKISKVAEFLRGISLHYEIKDNDSIVEEFQQELINLIEPRRIQG